MAEVELAGCRPDPLLSYLKALGVLRLVAEQADPQVRARWLQGTLALDTRLDRRDLVRFFIDEYRPTPLIGCWNGGSGFFPSDAKAGIEAIESSTVPRLALYRRVIALARATLDALGLQVKPDRGRKAEILAALRTSLPDEAVEWLDAAYVLTEEAPRYPPLLGTGAIDGRLEFTNNFMQRLCAVLPELGADLRRSEAWLEAALFARTGVPLLEASVGQFHPGGVGGPNATQGVEGESLVNPWELVLGLEGTLLLAGGAARRYTADLDPGNPRPAFPFTVQTSPVGYPTSSPAEYEGDAVRAEIWLPVWHRAASYREVSQLLTEGRITWAGRQARTGADVVRAIVSLGVDRGIAGFWRFGFLRRSGRAYLAAPLGYYRVTQHEGGTLLADLDRGGWLERLRRAATRERVPTAIRRALQAIEEAIVDYAGTPSESERRRALQRLLVAVWQAEVTVARSRQFRESSGLSPFPGVSPRWLPFLDDGSTAFRLAKSIAAVGSRRPSDATLETERAQRLGPKRAHLEPVELQADGRWVWRDGSPRVVGRRGSLERQLLELLYRRVMESTILLLPYPDIDSVEPCSLADIGAYLQGRVDDRELEQLIGGLSLVRWDQAAPASGRGSGLEPRTHLAASRASTLPWAYALFKLLFLPWPIARGGRRLRPEGAVGGFQMEPVPVRPDPSVLLRLMAGDVAAAVRQAQLRLRAAGLEPPRPTYEDSAAWQDTAVRIGAALLLPVAEVPTLWTRAGLGAHEGAPGELEVARA
ncbi:MAG: type I-U CRISPR-associated protein Csx17 [Firmicutes bacterium]|nr:type I-U CRISPR-associated protein Csx17 [Bacillota bacterium]